MQNVQKELILKALDLYGAPASVRDIRDEIYCMGADIEDPESSVRELLLDHKIAAAGQDPDTRDPLYVLTQLGWSSCRSSSISVDRKGHITGGAV